MYKVFDVRRFTALDMFGTAGTLRRRRIIVAEFVVGCPTVFGMAALVLRSGHLLFGGWLLGVAFNYLPLAAHAISLFPDGRVEAELADLTGRRRPQLLLLVPFLVALVATVELLAPALSRRRRT